MQKQIQLRLLPNEANQHQIIVEYIAAIEAVSIKQVNGYYITKQSIDARSRKQIWINLTVCAFINEPFQNRAVTNFSFKQVHQAKHSVVIIGAGPAGYFAALQLLEKGIKPIVLERGKPVRERRRDLAQLNKQGIVNPDSNYCFGEGGAGTYSDGKLYTRSNKRGNINRILELFVRFGADEKILYQSHPHIGTNKLPKIMEAMRQAIIDYGGEVHFEKKVIDFQVSNQQIQSVKTQDGVHWTADNYLLATGHSARDIFTLLHNKQIAIEAKPFALGVRVEHPQHIIDTIQYHCVVNAIQPRNEHLPPAAYSLVEQVGNYGVFSFCMCPGGIIAPAATNPNELVVNGWSPSKRNNPYANSGMVATVDTKTTMSFLKQQGYADKELSSPLLLMNFQQSIEQLAYTAGGGGFKAPANRMIDFCNNITSTNLPENSYIPGLTAHNLQQVLPIFIHTALQQGFIQFGKKMKGFYTNEAVVVATESRTSSPVRIPRNADNLQHIQIHNLYPCAEGAGYAGGIVSAAMDGEKVALAIALKLAL